ncbi:MAG: DUF1152 domain-containing protein, partial [Bacteroidota bacterium]
MIPFFQQLEDSQNILLAGAGGGFDIYCGIPLYFYLKKQGKQVTLGNFSFTWLGETSAELVTPHCYKIEGHNRDLSGRNYFPEKYLKLWLAIQNEYPNVYAFERTGVNPLKKAYKHLIDKHKIDTVILIDGGTDSLMFGDEEGLGTPQEDICSMAAVYRTGIQKQFLVSVGFGIDHYHGVSHFLFLENLSTLIKEGGYLGLFQYSKEMEEVQKYMEAVKFANDRMRGMESIVSNSIVSALEGEYGNIHKTQRTRNSELWINPLMSICWCFDLKKIIQKNKYFS